MNMSYSYPTTMYESILAQKYVFLVLFTFLVFTMNFLSKNEKKNQPEKIHLGENIFIHCSRINVVNGYVNVFL